MRIQHNIMAMNAYRNYTNNTSALSKNLEKLSSGYKINRAGDDAAGLAISEKMRAQITGLQTAQKNAKDGISLVQTAEGALTEVHDMLNRMVELATQSANGTYDNDVDRVQLQKELDQLRAEIDRIADSSNFNGIKLLDGSMDSNAVSGVKYTAKSAKDIENLLPKNMLDDASQSDLEDANIGVNGALETENDIPKSDTSFQVSLDGIGEVTVGEDETFSLKIGDDELTLDDLDPGTYTGRQLAEKLSAKYDGKDGTDTFKLGNDEFDVEANGNVLTFTAKDSKTAAPLNDKAKVTWSVDGSGDDDETTTSTASPAKLEATVTYSADPTWADNDTVSFSSTGGTTTLNVTATYNATGNSWSVTGAPTGYTATFDGTKLTLVNSTDGAVSVSSPFGTISATTTNAGSPTLTVMDDWTDGVDGPADNSLIDGHADEGGDSDSGSSASAITGEAGTAIDVKGDGTPGTAAVYSFTLTGKGESDFTSKAIDGVNVTWSTDLDTTMGDFVESYNQTSGKDYTASWDSENSKLVLTAKNEGTVASAPTTDITGVTASEDTQGAAGTSASITMDASGLDKDAIKAAADGIANIVNGDVTIEMNSDNKLELKVSGNVVATSDETVDGNSASFTFKNADGESLGSVSVTGTLNASDITGEIETGLTYALATGDGDDNNDNEVPEGTQSAEVDLSGISVDTADPEATLTAADVTVLQGLFGSADGTTQGSASKVTINSEVEIDLTGIADDYDATTTIQNLADDMLAKAKQAVEDWNTANSAEKGYKYTNVRISSTPAGAEGDIIAQDAGGSLYILADIEELSEEPASAATKSGYINTGIQNPTKYNAGSNAQLAHAAVDFGDAGAWTDGSKITIGDTTYTVAIGKDSKFKNSENVVYMDTSDKKEAAMALAAAAKDNSIFTVGHDGNGKTTLQQKSSVKESTDMTTREKFASYLGVSVADTTSVENAKQGTGLTLQIGDTADTYNKLKVNIKDMHSASLGLDGLSIANQDGAAAAIAKIKAAINTVSDVRGTLGATQNRLDHTINNLSVMTENIQDAESTIRDTDIAEEMMAYTKNNILVQSAQAMLAQANQVPQGVLQLLQ